MSENDEVCCSACGLACTTGAMAAFCPRADQCEFWPHSDGTPNHDGGELLIAKMWIHNACEQIGLQIEERKRLQRELDKHSPDFATRVLAGGDAMTSQENARWQGIAIGLVIGMFLAFILTKIG